MSGDIGADPSLPSSSLLLLPHYHISYRLTGRTMGFGVCGVVWWCGLVWFGLVWLVYNRGCVTPQILANIATHGITLVSGFSNLRAEDQRKVRMALATRRIDPADIPESARPGPLPGPPALNTPSSSQAGPASSQVTAPPSSQVTAPTSSQTAPTSSQQGAAGPSQKKRKAALEAAMAAGAGPSQHVAHPPVRRMQGPGNTTWEEGAEEDVPEEDPVDELYCTMSSSVVGLQYYKGAYVSFRVVLVRLCFLFTLPLRSC